jgi:hypothetical protein
MDVVVSVIIIALAVAVYFLPTWIASNRKHHRADTIFWINLLLGWMLLGWIVALVWSLSEIIPADKSENAPQKQCPECAEMVLDKAKICKHCRHDFGEPTHPKTQEPPSTPEVQGTTEPTKAKRPITKEEALALAEKYGIRRDGELFDYKGEKFSKFSTALQFAHAQEKQRGR